MYLLPFHENWVETIFQPSSDTTAPTLTYKFGEFAPYHNGLQAAIAQCQWIYQTTGKRLLITLSGGVDSQTVVYAAHLSGVPFQVYSLRFNDGLNSHDLLNGQLLCSQLNIPIQYIDIDIIKFYTTEKYLDYVYPYRCSSPQIASHLWLYKQIQSNNGVIISSGNPVIKHPRGYDGINNYTLYSWNRFAQIEDCSIVGFFHWYSRELFGSLYRSIPDDQADLYKVKCDIYTENQFLFIPQEKKMNGFEQVKQVFIAKYPKAYAPFDSMFRYPHEAALDANTFAVGLK